MTTPERKIRCRVSSRSTRNPCASAEVTEFGFCLTHLQEAHAEYEAVLEEHGIRPPRQSEGSKS